MLKWIFAFAAVLALALPSAAFDYPERLRSDLPFWGDQGGGVDERHYPIAYPGSCGGETVGWCTRIPFGDWKWSDDFCGDMVIDEKVPPQLCKHPIHEEDWFRFDLMGIMDGGGHITHGASSREELDHREVTYSVIGELGKAPNGEELFAIQLGFIGGSSYVLLAGRPGTDNAIREVRELNFKCDKKTRGVEWREADFDSFHLTGYCVVRRPSQLRDLALAALSGESRTFKWVDVPPRWKELEKKPAAGAIPLTGSPKSPDG